MVWGISMFLAYELGAGNFGLAGLAFTILAIGFAIAFSER